MARAAHIVSIALLLPMTSVADDLEAGGFVGAASTNASNTDGCGIIKRSPSEPADECVYTPQHGSHGAVLGAQLRYRVRRAVYVETNLIYAQKGYNDGFEVRLHYVEVPVLVHVDPFAEAFPSRAFVVAGLAPALLVACRTTGQYFANEPPPHVETYSGPCEDQPYADRSPRRFDLSAVVGVGVGWQIGSGAVEIQARAVRGLIDVDGFMESGKTVSEAAYVIASFSTKL